MSVYCFLGCFYTNSTLSCVLSEEHTTPSPPNRPFLFFVSKKGGMCFSSSCFSSYFSFGWVFPVFVYDFFWWFISFINWLSDFRILCGRVNLFLGANILRMLEDLTVKQLKTFPVHVRRFWDLKDISQETDRKVL